MAPPLFGRWPAGENSEVVTWRHNELVVLRGFIKTNVPWKEEAGQGPIIILYLPLSGTQRKLFEIYGARFARKSELFRFVADANCFVEFARKLRCFD